MLAISATGTEDQGPSCDWVGKGNKAVVPLDERYH